MARPGMPGEHGGMSELDRTEVALPTLAAALVTAPWVAVADLGAWGPAHWRPWDLEPSLLPLLLAAAGIVGVLALASAALQSRASERGSRILCGLVVGMPYAVAVSYCLGLLINVVAGAEFTAHHDPVTEARVRGGWEAVAFAVLVTAAVLGQLQLVRLSRSRAAQRRHPGAPPGRRTPALPDGPAAD